MRFIQASDRLVRSRYLSGPWHWSRGPWVTRGVWERFTGGQKGGLLLGSDNLVSHYVGNKIVQSTLASCSKVLCYFSPYFETKLTFIKYSVHVKSICGTGLKISAATHIYTQLLDSLVLNHTCVSATNLICRKKNKHRVCTERHIAQYLTPKPRQK